MAEERFTCDGLKLIDNERGMIIATFQNKENSRNLADFMNGQEKEIGDLKSKLQGTVENFTDYILDLQEEIMVLKSDEKYGELERKLRDCEKFRHHVFTNLPLR